MLSASNRQCKKETRTFPQFAFNPDTSTVEFHDCLGDGKAEACALLFLVIVIAELFKFSKNLLKFFSRDTGSSVFHAALQLIFFTADKNCYMAFFRELYGISDQVGEDLKNAIMVCFDRCTLAKEFFLAFDLLGLC